MKSLFIALIAFLLLASSVLGIGVTPPRIITDDVLKGSTITQSVKLVDVSEGDVVKIALSGEGSEWITLETGSEFTVGADVEPRIPFTLNIPTKAPNGAYKVRAQITILPNAQGEGGANTASVISGILVEISFTVTGEEVKKYTIRSVRIPHFEVGMPLAVVATIKNEGNVIARPSKAVVAVKDKETKEALFSDEGVFSEGVDPFLIGNSVATIPVDLEKDLYFADVALYDGSKKIHEETDIPFDILARGTLDASAELRELFVQENVQSIAKITATLANTGTVALHAVIHFEIYYEDALVDTIQTASQYVEVGETQEYIAHYTPQRKGEHVVHAYASFSGKKSNTKETNFLSGVAHAASFGSVLVWIIAALILLGIILQIIIIKRNNTPKPHAVIHPITGRAH